MFAQKYGIASAEVLDILDNMDEEDVKKIPTKFIDFLKENADKNYKVELDYSKPLYEMDLNQETIDLLGVMYEKYWCPEDKLQEFKRKIAENEEKYQEELRKKYNPENIFSNSDDSVGSSTSENFSSLESSESAENNSISDKPANIEEKQGIFSKIISFFKGIFVKN